jgi:hypothetical protein
MKFAKVVFWIAGVWGILVLTPMYFLYGRIGQSSPPAPTHPEFYFGFVGVGLAFQIVFLVIATDPIRFRPMIIPALFEKWGYVIAMMILHSQQRINAFQFSTAVPDALLGLLFLAAFFKTRPTAGQKASASAA